MGKIIKVMSFEPAKQKTTEPPKRTIQSVMKEKQAERKKHISDQRFSGKGF